MLFSKPKKLEETNIKEETNKIALTAIISGLFLTIATTTTITGYATAKTTQITNMLNASLFLGLTLLTIGIILITIFKKPKN